eukprot:3040077-Prymnesium_polylepis.1
MQALAGDDRAIVERRVARIVGDLDVRAIAHEHRSDRNLPLGTVTQQSEHTWVDAQPHDPRTQHPQRKQQLRQRFVSVCECASMLTRAGCP